MAYYPITVDQNLSTATYNGAGTLYGGVTTPTGVLYSFYIGVGNDPYYCKSTDNGRTWGTSVQIDACNCVNMAIWYDRWSGIDADLIHVVYTDSGVDDVFYRA